MKILNEYDNGGDLVVVWCSSFEVFFDVIALGSPLKLKSSHNFTNQLIENFITFKNSLTWRK